MVIPAVVNDRLNIVSHNLLFVTVSGAHLYGFDSPDSDWDLRGAYSASLRDLVGIEAAPETYEELAKESDPETDIVLHEARKFFRMLLKNNGYVLEQVFSPLVVRSSAWFDELRDIAKRCICKQHRHHFFHFGIDQWRNVTAASTPTVKSLLYTYRPLLAGIHLMRTGQVESNLRHLNEEFGYPQINDLIARKLAGAEKMAISPSELDLHRPVFDQLCEELDRARDKSPLPDSPAGAAELNELLIRIRLGKHSPVPSLQN